MVMAKKKKKVCKNVLKSNAKLLRHLFMIAFEGMELEGVECRYEHKDNSHDCTIRRGDEVLLSSHGFENSKLVGSGWFTESPDGPKYDRTKSLHLVNRLRIKQLLLPTKTK